MWLRRQWIIGLIGLLLVGLAKGQQGAAANAEAVEGAETNATETETKPPLTGNPQIDYKYDPNLPHELRGYDLSDYPFYARLPEDLLLPSFNFSCDDRHDGFYASVPHKCQVYHNCLFGQRYDFLCANYTVFDQKNFICHYVSEVDCANSANHFDRNDELYVTTTTSTTTPAPPQIIYVERPRPLGGPGLIRPNRPRPFRQGNRRPGPRPGARRTSTTPAPVYDDYYYYDDYYDQYYDDYYNDPSTTTTTTTTQRPRRPNRPQRTRVGGEGRTRPSARIGNIFNVKDRKRPRINPPVPVDDGQAVERPRSSRLQQSSNPRQQSINDAPVEEPPQDIGQEAPSGPRRRRPGRKPRPGSRPKKTTTTTTTTTTTEAIPEEDYYDYYYDYEDEPSSTTTTTTAAPVRPSRPSLSRPRPGGLPRGQQNRPETATATTTEAPRGRGNQPSRVNVRRNPVGSRKTPIEGAVSFDNPREDDPPQETGGAPRLRPQRLRPQSPRSRPQSEQNVDIIEEEPPLAPGLDFDEGPVDRADTQVSRRPAGEERVRPRGPVRRPGQGGPGRQAGQRVRNQRRPPPPDYYDY